MAEGDADRYLVPMLAHALRLLDTLAEAPDGGATLQELVTRTGVSKSSAFRALHTLARFGLVLRDSQTGRYRLGPRLPELASRVSASGTVQTRALPVMNELRARFGETANLAALEGDRVVYVHIVEGTHALRLSSSVGDVAPWHAAAVAKAILSVLPTARRKQVLQGQKFEARTPSTLTTRTALDRAVAEAEERGHALDEEETEPGAYCIAVPLPDETRPERPLALSLSGPVQRMLPRRNELLAALQDARARILGTRSAA